MTCFGPDSEWYPVAETGAWEAVLKKRLDFPLAENGRENLPEPWVGSVDQKAAGNVLVG